MKKHLLILITVLFSKLIFSQNGWNAYITTYTSSTFITGVETSLAIDKYGNKWIGFTNGQITSPAAVAKYNKAGGFWNFYCQANIPAIPNNHVTALACDTSGNVWIGTIAGLVKYDGSTFTAYTTANGLPDDNILSLDCYGNMIYIGTSNGLCRYNGSIFTNYNTANSLLGNDTILSIKAQSPTQIWLGNNNQLTELNFNTNYTFSSYNTYSTPFSIGKTNCIYIDSIGNKWLGTSLNGVVKFDNTNFTLASSTYSDVTGAYLPTSCLDITKGPNNGILFYTTCGAYSTPSGTSSSCLLELLANKQYKPYYVSNSNYTIGKYLETDLNNEIFLSHLYFYSSGGLLKLMFSFNNSLYNPVLQGPGNGVNSSNFKFLDINRVKAGIANRGDMFWDIGGTGNASYEVPKGSNSHSGFCKALWIGGLDESNQLHLAAQTYRQSGDEFWPGPLDTLNATCDTSSFKNYDKIWKISYTDINDFITNFQNGNIANNTYTPSLDIITWPAKGTGNLSRNLAPFIDVNNNGIYDPLTGGDYPQIKGDQTLYFIFNDKFAVHSESWGAPLGFEIHCMAYAYGCPNFINGKNELAYSTFYNYKIYNRSNTNYHNLIIGLYDDIDLGNYTDDYIGCHLQSNLGFSYNADGYDENINIVKGYLNYPPAAGSIVLKGPLAPPNDGIDNNNNGQIDEANEECLMNEFVYSNAPFSAFPLSTQSPATANQFYNYLNARWRDSSNFTCGGNGYGGSVPTKFMYPWSYYNGMPCNLWSDGVNPKGDRRHIISIGPFNLNAKDNVEFEFAQAWAVDSSSTGNNIGAVNKLISDAQKITAFYKTTTQSTCLPNMAIGINEKQINNFDFRIFPNPVQNKLSIQANDYHNSFLEITNMFGQILMSQRISNSESLEIDASSLKSGVYFIKLSKDNSSSVKKFIKD